MAIDLLPKIPGVSEMTESEMVEAADYTSQHYFSIDARTFLARIRSGSLDASDPRASRVLSMIAPVRNLIEPN